MKNREALLSGVVNPDSPFLREMCSCWLVLSLARAPVVTSLVWNLLFLLLGGDENDFRATYGII